MAITGDAGTQTPSVLPSIPLHEPTSQPEAPTRSGGPLLRAALRMILVLLLGIAVLRWLGVAVQILLEPNGGFDFISYYAAALALRDNPAANIYGLHALQVAALAHHAPYPGTLYMYPPLLAVALIPLTWLPPDTALHLWAVFNLLLWLACLVLIARLLRRLLRAARPAHLGRRFDADARLFVVAIVAFLALTYDPLAAGIGLGQINVVICFLVLLALELELHGRPGLAGAALALASLLKVYPLLLLAYYALRGRWRVVRGGGIAFVVLIAGMLPVLGIQGLLMTRGFFAAGDTAVTLAHNEALLRAPFWIATLAGAEPGAAANLLGMLLVALVGLAFVTGTLWALKLPTASPGVWWRGWLRRLGALAAETAGRNEVMDIFGYLWALCTMVLLAPVSWEHSYTWLLPALIPGFGYVLLIGVGRRRTTLFLAALTLSYALTTADFPLGFDQVEHFTLGPMVFGHPLRPVFMLMRPLGALLAWAAMGWLFLDARRGAPADSTMSENRMMPTQTAPTPPALTLRRLAGVLVSLLGAVMLMRGAIVAIMVIYGAAYGPTALLR
ncbi:MAG TPA: glycosyltransferase 87 family protein [Ktedonobacterales bacterium]|nr:glycosyltransferase 87 family protein [Ktedonobacterales bacterium]